MVTVSPTLNKMLANQEYSERLPTSSSKNDETMYTNHTHEVHFLKNRYFQIEKLD